MQAHQLTKNSSQELTTKQAHAAVVKEKPKLEVKNSEPTVNPQNFTWHPYVRDWAYSVTTDSPSFFWKRYPNPSSVQIHPEATLSENNKLTLDFLITFQPPAACKIPTKWKDQCTTPYQDILAFQCTTDSKEAELLAFSPGVPNKTIKLSSESSFHIGPEVEIGAGLNHENVHGEFKIGVGHLSNHHKTSQGIKAIEVNRSNLTGNKGFQVVETLMYCNPSSTECQTYNLLEPDDSIIKSNKIIFGWNTLCSLPAVAKNNYVMRIKGTYQLPSNYKITDLKFKLNLAQRLNCAEVWKLDRTQGFINWGSTERELVVHNNKGKLECKLQASGAGTDSVVAKHYVHSMLTRFDCCFFASQDKNSTEKVKDEAHYQTHLTKLNLSNYT